METRGGGVDGAAEGELGKKSGALAKVQMCSKADTEANICWVDAEFGPEDETEDAQEASDRVSTSMLTTADVETLLRELLQREKCALSYGDADHAQWREEFGKLVSMVAGSELECSGEAIRGAGTECWPADLR